MAARGWGREAQITKRHKEVFGNDGCVHYLHCFLDAYMCQNTSNCPPYVYIPVWQLYLSKVVKESTV